jgi:long-subunit fatty acid transport protein
MKSLIYRHLLIASLPLLFTAQAGASGYEKSIMWGGRSAGLAGIATPYVKGSQALYFNPAGIAAEKTGTQDLSLNVSPTWSQFKAPINNNNDIVTSDRKLLVPFGLTYARNVSDSWAVAVGYYVSAGAFADYQDVSFAGVTGRPEVKTDLQVTEAALGVGYRANEHWSFGAAWRMVMAKADFAFVQRAAPTIIANVKVKDLDDTNYAGFKLGAQYRVDDDTRFALTYRSQVHLDAAGKIATTVYNGGSTTNFAEGDATAHTIFPQAITLGAEHRLSDQWRLLGEYVWTNYKKINTINVDGRSGAAVNPQLELHWNNQSNVRIAAEYRHFMWPLRFGYVWTSQVTRNETARPSFTPPGPAHTVTLGTGQEFGFGEQSLAIDGGLEYTVASGEGHGATAGTGTAGTDIRSGKYSVEEIALHLGATYGF